MIIRFGSEVPCPLVEQTKKYPNHNADEIPNPIWPMASFFMGEFPAGAEAVASISI